MLRPSLVAAVVAATVVGGGVTWAVTSPDGSSAVPASAQAAPSAARTTLPGLAPASGEPTLPGVDAAAPAPGTVGRIAGPFDDRFTLSGVRLGAGRVSGALEVTSDVSDLLELQVLVAFYDRSGSLLAVGRSTHHQGESHQHVGPPSEREPFTVAAPARLRDRVSSAAVGVPVLVNE